MCVTLTKSRKLPCTTATGGTKAVTFGAYNPLARLAKTPTGVTEIATVFGVGTLARVAVKNSTTNYVENGVSGGDNRSVGVTGNLPIVISVPKGTSIETVTFIKQVISGEVVAFIEKNDGTITAAGSQLGGLVITADYQTGGALTDLNGWTITLQTMEPDFSEEYVLVGDALTDYTAALLAV